MLRFIYIFTILVLVFGAPLLVEAYAVPTHAYLTGEVIDFYNQNFPGNQISAEEREDIIQGAKDEDDHTRFLNHFYDPVHNRGLSRDTAIDPWYFGGNWPTSKYWANSEDLERNPIFGGNFAWPSAAREYARGNKKEAMLALGHVLHLIEDLGVPEHARNDPHAFGSPYEDFASKFNLENPDPKMSDLLSSHRPVILDSLDTYFDELANYTNRNFYSPKTIGIQSGFSLPASEDLEKEGSSWFRFATDENGEKYHLVQQMNPYTSILISTKSNFSLLDNEGLIMHDYWSRLAPQVISYGAGVIHLLVGERVIATTTTPSLSVSIPPSPSTPAQNFYGGATAEIASVVLPSVVAREASQPDPALGEALSSESSRQIEVSSTPIEASSTPIETSSTPLEPGIHNLSWRVNPAHHSVVFTATVVSPDPESQVWFDMEFKPAEDPLGENYRAGLNSPQISSGATTSIEIPNVESGRYHWEARGAAFKWATPPTEEESVDFDMSLPAPKASVEANSLDFPNGYCGFGGASIVPSEDFVLDSAEFKAACSNGDCLPANTFQVLNASGTLLAETDGTGISFGYPGFRDMLTFFKGDGQITLHAGEKYLVTPHSYRGTCAVPIGSTFNLR